MFSLNNKVSVRQLQALLVLNVLGTGIIFLPRKAAELAMQDGWIVIAVTTVFAVALAFLINSVGRMFPGDSFVTYTSRILSRPVSVLISLLFVAKLIIDLSLELRLFCEVVKQTLLAKTPFYIVSALMLAAAAFIASKGYEARARIAELLIILVTFPILFVFGVGLFDIDFSNLMPVCVTPPGRMVWGGFSVLYVFTGLEFCLLFYPYSNRPKATRAGIVKAVIFIGAFLIFITAVTIAKFGPFDVRHQMWPLLEMMDIIDLPGSFIERQDALIMSFWIVSTFAIVNAGLFFSSLILKDVVNKGSHSLYIVICALVAFVMAFIPENIEQIYELQDYMFFTFGLFFLIALPVVLIATARLRGLGERYK